MVGCLADILVAKNTEPSEHFILKLHSFFQAISHLKSCLRKHFVSGSQFSH